MKTMRWFLTGFAALSLSGLTMAAGQAGQTSTAAPTYTKDVAPILFKNCTSCHRPGEIAPMSLLTYEDVRPYAKDIRDEVSEGHMPPWPASIWTASRPRTRCGTSAAATRTSWTCRWWR